MDMHGVVDFVDNSRNRPGDLRSQRRRGSGGWRVRVRVRGPVRGQGLGQWQSRGGQRSRILRWGPELLKPFGLSTRA